MNGPEHYRKAEQLLATVQGTGMGDEMSRDRLTAAQAHAALALAAANVVAFALDATSTDPDDWAALTLPSAENTELRLRKAVAEMLHDADTSPDADASAVIARFREGLPATVHGDPVLALADELMLAEGGV